MIGIYADGGWPAGHGHGQIVVAAREMHMGDEMATIDERDMAAIAGLVERYGVEAVVTAARGMAQPRQKKVGRPAEQHSSLGAKVGIWIYVQRARNRGKSVTDAARALAREPKKAGTESRLSAQTLAKIYHQIEARRKVDPQLESFCALGLHGLDEVFARFEIDPATSAFVPSGVLGQRKK